MKCIVKEREFGRLGAGKTRLINSDNLTPILSEDKEGYKAKLTVTEEGHKLTTSTGETIKRGKSKDIFAIVKALDFDVQPLKVVDEIKDKVLPYDKYEKKYAEGLINRDVTRRFTAAIIADQDAGTTALGVAERAGGKTLAIHSVFLKEYLTNQARTYFLLNYIGEELDASDFAFITANGAQLNKVDLTKYEDKLRIYGASKKRTAEALELAEDAMTRRSDVIEEFDEPIKYKGAKDIAKEKTVQ